MVDVEEQNITNVATILTNTNKIPHIVSSMDFWGAIIEQLQLTGTLQSNLALAGANVVIVGLPAGITITRVVVMFMCRAIQNSNATINNLDGAQNIQVNFAAGVFTNGIAMATGLFSLAGSTTAGGTVMVGAIDVKTTVTGNGTCTFQIDAAKALLANLNFLDYQIGIRIYFTP